MMVRVAENPERTRCWKQRLPTVHAAALRTCLLCVACVVVGAVGKETATAQSTHADREGAIVAGGVGGVAAGATEIGAAGEQERSSRPSAYPSGGTTHRKLLYSGGGGGEDVEEKLSDTVRLCNLFEWLKAPRFNLETAPRRPHGFKRRFRPLGARTPTTRMRRSSGSSASWPRAVTTRRRWRPLRN